MDDKTIRDVLAKLTAICESRGLDAGGLVRYVEHGILPGSFLTAVLEDKLVESAMCADDNNLPRLHMWADIMYNAVPRAARGSHGVVAEWSKGGGLRGIQQSHDEHAAAIARGGV